MSKEIGVFVITIATFLISIITIGVKIGKLGQRVEENEKDINELKITQKEDVKEIKNRLNAIESCVTSIQIAIGKMETLLTSKLGE